MNVAIGKESIKRAVNANNITKEEKIVLETTETKEKPTPKREVKKPTAKNVTKQVVKTNKTTSTQVISNIKSDLPTYLL
jgi:hypothetical protein